MWVENFQKRNGIHSVRSMGQSEYLDVKKCAIARENMKKHSSVRHWGYLRLWWGCSAWEVVTSSYCTRCQSPCQLRAYQRPTYSCFESICRWSKCPTWPEKLSTLVISETFRRNAWSGNLYVSQKNAWNTPTVWDPTANCFWSTKTIDSRWYYIGTASHCYPSLCAVFVHCNQ